MTIETLNFILACGTLALQLAVVAAFIDLAFFRGSRILLPLAPYALRLAFVLALGAAAFTLVYSGIYQVTPCPLCWWQRIFLYPQLVLFGLALWRPDHKVADYGIALSILGAGVSLYHHALQIFPGSLPCPAEALCAQRHIFEFGFITFPLMAFTIFAALIVLGIAAKRSA